MIYKNEIEYFLFRVSQKLFEFIGIDKTRRAAMFVGALFYYFLPIRKKTTLENISKAFPDKTTTELKKLVLKNYQNITITFFELLCIPSMSIEFMKDQVEFVGIDLLNDKLKEQKGLIIFTGHFGSWEFLMTSMAVNIGKKFNVLMRPQRNSKINEWLKATRAQFGAKIIDAGISVKELYKALMNKEAVGIAGDQRGHYDNPRFNFFNQPTALYTGTASIALRTNSNVILALAARQSNFKYKCYLEELNFDNLPDDDELKINELTQRYINFIEKYVREYPDQYFWMHKLWKY